MIKIILVSLHNQLTLESI